MLLLLNCSVRTSESVPHRLVQVSVASRYRSIDTLPGWMLVYRRLSVIPIPVICSCLNSPYALTSDYQISPPNAD